MGLKETTGSRPTFSRAARPEDFAKCSPEVEAVKKKIASSPALRLIFERLLQGYTLTSIRMHYPRMMVHECAVEIYKHMGVKKPPPGAGRKAKFFELLNTPEPPEPLTLPRPPAPTQSRQEIYNSLREKASTQESARIIVKIITQNHSQINHRARAIAAKVGLSEIDYSFYVEMICRKFDVTSVGDLQGVLSFDGTASDPEPVHELLTFRSR